MLQGKNVRRMSVTLYDRSSYSMRVVTQIGRFYKAPDRDVLVIAVEHLRGGRGIEVFYTTDVDADVETVLQRYSWRWSIEEFHKAFKTGTSVKKRQLKDTMRLEPMVALMSVVAVRLLQLKTLANSEPNRPARTVVPQLWLQMLKAVRKNLRRVHDLTIYEFYREVAKLGGFPGRKSDGEPGWITIWRGWETLKTLMQGAELALQFRG
jgi:hypothetical protein